MEETIGYEALFTSEEWNSLEFGDWDSEPMEGGGGMGELIRYAVTLTVWVEATSEDEAQLSLERHLAGSFDSEVIEVTSPKDDL